MKKNHNESERRTSDEDFEAFLRALPDLLKTDLGLFVAFSGGRFIDKDSHQLALVERVFREHPGKKVLIQRVVASGLVDVYMETPEFSEIRPDEEPKTRIAHTERLHRHGAR